MNKEEKSDLRIWLLAFGMVISGSALFLAAANTYFNYHRYKHRYYRE